MEGVFHEHGNGHGADAAGDGGNGGGVGGGFVEGDVAGEAEAGLFGGIRYAVDANVDDDGSGFDPFTTDHFGAADGGDENVGAAADGGEILGARVGDGDGGVGTFGEKEERHGLADDHAAANDNGLGTSGGDAGFGE